MRGAWWILILVPSLLQARQTDTVQIREIHRKAISFYGTYPDSLFFYGDSSFRMAQRANDQAGLIDAYSVLGLYHSVKGDYAKAIERYNQSYRLCLETDNIGRLSKVYSNYGSIYSRLGHYPKAINYFLESLKISEASNSLENMAGIYNNLGVAYKNYGELEAALSSYRQSLTLNLKLDNAINTAGCYTNIGNIHQMKKNYDSALFYHNRALVMFDSLKNLRGIVVCYNNIGEVSYFKGDYEEALNYRINALNLSRTQNFFSSQISALHAIGTIKIAQGKPEDAERVLLNGIRLVKEKNYRTELVNFYKEISVCYKMLGRTNDALKFLEQHSSLRDSIYNTQNQTTISNLRLAYDVEKKEADINLLKLDNEVHILTRNLVISGAILIVLIGGMIVGRQRLKIRMNNQLLKQQEQLHAAQQEVTQLELKNAKLKEDELRLELEFKNKSLTTYALNMVQKNEILEEVRESIEEILKAPQDQQNQFKRLSKLVDYSLTLDKDWDDFKLYFNDVHQGFFNSIQSRFPDLTSSEIRLCALLRLNLSAKQVSAILRISPESVKMARHRLRKKFNLQPEDNLISFIMSV